jgi:hypothetical protein
MKPMELTLQKSTSDCCLKRIFRKKRGGQAGLEPAGYESAGGATQTNPNQPLSARL